MFVHVVMMVSLRWICTGGYLLPHPAAILFIAPLEMNHPVAQRLESIRCQLLPNGRDVTVEKRPSNVIQLAAHSHLTSQGLWDTAESEQTQRQRCLFSQSNLLTFCSSTRDCCMRITNLLKRSSSWSRTTDVGEMSASNFFWMTSRSNNLGSLLWMSWATWLMYASLVMPPPDSPVVWQVRVQARVTVFGSDVAEWVMRPSFNQMLKL